MRRLKMLPLPKIGLLRSSSKPFERRIPIHPLHFDLIDPLIKKHIYLEAGYLQDFGYSDSFCQKQGLKIEERKSLIASADCCFLVRPTSKDLGQMRENATAFGWMHCVQHQDTTEVAIDKRLTLVCMESLFDAEGEYLFQENSRITGQQAIRHALNITKQHDTRHHVTVIGHGSAGISAIHELIGMGFANITCLSRRSRSDIKNAVDGVQYIQMKHTEGAPIHTMSEVPILDLLKKSQIIVNATAQDIYRPAIFLHHNDIDTLCPGTLIIDISCDRKMGFEFSKITSLDAPLIEYGSISYCAIDHLPTLDFNYASEAISQALIPIMPSFFKYLSRIERPPLIAQAIQVEGGKVLNPDITYYQKHFP